MRSRSVASARRKAVNLSVDADLLWDARDLGINLSRDFEDHLASTVDYIESHGVFSDGLKRF